MASSAFEKLDVYRPSEDLADDNRDVVTTWDHLAKCAVGMQLVRAADSIGANIAEGAGRGNYPDNRRFVRIGRGSLNETTHFLRRAFRRRLLSAQRIEQLHPRLDELAPRLNAYLKSIGPVDKLRRKVNKNRPTQQWATDSGTLTTDH